MSTRSRDVVAGAAAVLLLLAPAALRSADLDSEPAAAAPKKPPASERSKDPPGMKRLMPQYDVWIDSKHKRVVMDGTVCLNRGQARDVCLPRGTKEHESIVAVDTQAYIVHAALLAVGAKPGSPVDFDPKYRPASGTEIGITVIWTDEHGKPRREPAQNWIRNVKTGEPMKYTWVFAGSGFWQDQSTSTKHYMAEGGDFICVANFPRAMLDLPVASSQVGSELMFDAFEKHIPPLGTKVRLVLTPKQK